MTGAGLKIVSWNVNGLRAVLRRNFLAYLAEEKPDMLCLQETRAESHEVEPLWPAEYEVYWNPAQKKGYSGTALFTRIHPRTVGPGMGKPVHDAEGRVLTAEYEDFFHCA